MNVAGELLDIAAAGRGDGADAAVEEDPRLDPAAVAEDLRRRYEGLWHELTTDEVFGADEEGRLAERIGRLNDLGFDVDELELVDDPQAHGRHVLRLTTCVVEPGHHRRRLLQLTGLDVQENQARRLLNAPWASGWLERRSARPCRARSARCAGWSGVRPTLTAVPRLRAKLGTPDLHQISSTWFMSEQAGADVGTEAATPAGRRPAGPASDGARCSPPVTGVPATRRDAGGAAPETPQAAALR
jgi:hypothetical protein